MNDKKRIEKVPTRDHEPRPLPAQDKAIWKRDRQPIPTKVTDTFQPPTEPPKKRK